MVDFNNTQIAYSPQELSNEKKPSESTGESEFNFFGEDGFSFWDFVDMVNPLQHIPLVATAYREITGDEIDPGARLAGGTLFGGPIGLAASTFNVILEHNTGKDSGEHVVAWFNGEEEPLDESQTMMAQNGQNPAVSSFAPIVPESEADAIAAGEASLRMAELQQFMSPSTAQEVPVAPTPSHAKGAGSAGTWAPPLKQDHPFPTERPNEQVSPQVSTLYQARPEVETAQVQSIAQPKQAFGFRAKQTHNESVSALQAFARDIKSQQQSGQVQAVLQPAQPPITNTSQLNQTNDNAWFTNMMSQNIDQYGRPDIKG